MRCEQVLLVLNFLSSETWKFSSGKRRLNRMHLFFSFFLFSAQEVRGYSSLSSYCDVTYHKSAYDVGRIQTLELWVSCFFCCFLFFFPFPYIKVPFGIQQSCLPNNKSTNLQNLNIFPQWKSKTYLIYSKRLPAA